MKKIILCLFLCLFASTGMAEHGGGTLPPLEEVLQINAASVDPQTLRVDFHVADGFFVFTNKLRFQSQSPGITLGSTGFPDAAVIKDSFFGDLKVFQGKFGVNLPLLRTKEAENQIKLKLTVQQCLHPDKCYPLHTEVLNLPLEAAQVFVESKPAEEVQADAAPPQSGPIVSSSYSGNSMDDDFLDPEVAFLLSSELVESNLIAVRWKIADGYYLYRDKFQFSPQNYPEVLGKVELPEGELKKDEFFGEVQVFHNQVEVLLPLKNLDGISKSLVVDVTYQGCADAGLCYPPIKKAQTFHLRTPMTNILQLRPAAPSKAAERGNTGIAQAKLFGGSHSTDGALRGVFGGGNENDDEQEFLEVDKAFIFTAGLEDDGSIIAHWQIAPAYYLYRDKFHFALKGGGVLGEPQYPPSKTKNDPNFGSVEVYYNRVVIQIPTKQTEDLKTLELEVKYQGCADAGLCYPPTTKNVVLPLDAGDTSSAVETSTSPAASVEAGMDAEEAVPEVFLSEQDEIVDSLKKNSFAATVLVFFGLGLLLALTPCVFPMIPILSSIIVGQGKDITTAKAFTMSLVYVLAMAVTYTVLGVLTALAGENLQAFFQNAWVLGSFAVVFVLLSFSMFGFYELQMPASIQSKLTEISNSREGGTLFGVAIMGFLSALIVGPCVTAPLMGALIYISQTRDAVLGGSALFALSMGMGAPLLLIGISAGKFLPRAGAWMNIVKYVFGVLLLAVAVWMLERILPLPVILVMAAALLIIPGTYMGALETLPQDASGWRKLWKGVGLLMVLYGTLLVIGAASGKGTFLQPLAGLGSSPGPMPMAGGGAAAGGTSAASAGAHITFRQIKGLEGLSEALAEAKAQGKSVMLDFYADWCISCKEMESFTFGDPKVMKLLENTMLLQADVTANDAQDTALYKHFGIFGPPSIMFYSRDGKELRQYRVVGFMPADRFADHVERALAQ